MKKKGKFSQARLIEDLYTLFHDTASGKADVKASGVAISGAREIGRQLALKIKAAKLELEAKKKQ